MPSLNHPPLALNRTRLPCRSGVTAGFTLIEMTIVMLIIALLVGSVIVGIDLINAAAIRGQIDQIQQYNAAVASFRLRFNCLPGDCPTATTFGFPARGTWPGQGDGNGLIEGVYQATGKADECFVEGAGEDVLFWVDLSQAGLIKGTFNTATANSFPDGATVTGPTAIAKYFPRARLGLNNSIFVNCGGVSDKDHNNYYTISQVTQINATGTGGLLSNPGITVQQAYAIDTKIDDGLPVSGAVTVLFINNYKQRWSLESNTGNSTSCFDYSISLGNFQYATDVPGNLGNPNCAITFLFQ